MNRRSFMKSLALTGLGAHCYLGQSPLSLKFNTAHAAEGKTLIVIFQRGGCDGLNTVVPYHDEHYYQLRPTIAIAPPDSTNPEAGLALDDKFALHPSLAPLLPYYQQGQLAVLPAVHYPDGSRSHFRGQHLIESAQLTDEASDGWLNRHMQTQVFSSPFRAVGIGDELAQSLRGSVTASSFTSLDNFGLGVSTEEESLLLNRIKPIFNQSAATNATKELLQRFGKKTFDDLAYIQSIRDQGYTVDNGAMYPENGFGRDLQQVAQLIKAGAGLELATVDIGGWDTHSNQGAGEATGSQARSLSSFAQGIAALAQDLGPHMNDVVIMTSTEFGRTAQENGSRGTDHGYASSWFVLGNTINGGIKGDWPGLAPDQLMQGRFLDMSVDYRDIYYQILQHHLLNSASSQVLPDFNPSGLNLFS